MSDEFVSSCRVPTYEAFLRSSDLVPVYQWQRRFLQYLQQNQRGLDKAQQRWNKLLALAEKKFGKVSQRTKTRAGQVLSVIKHELEGAPPPAKSLAGRAAAVLAKGAANGAATAQSPSTAGSTGQAYPAAPAAGYPGSTATVASGAAQSQAPPTAESVITGAATAPAAASSPSYPQQTAPSPAPQQYPTPAESETPATGAAGATETYPAAPQ